MSRIAKGLFGPVVVMALIAACGEINETGAFVSVPAASSFGSESPDLRTILAHEFAAAADAGTQEAVVGTEAVAATGDTIRQALAHEFGDDRVNQRRSDRMVTDLPVR